MTTILRIDVSARKERSLTRGLSQRFIDEWLKQRPADEIVQRDIGLNPPPAVSENWIAAAFTPEKERTKTQQATLQLSDTLIEEVEDADIILLGVPMYNYGMPSALKAWFDQVIRINKTFTFDLTRGDEPLEPILSGKHLVILSSRGEFGFEPGGVREDKNHLEPHIRTCSKYLGAVEDHLIAIEYQEFGDERHRQSVENAHRAVPKLVDHLIEQNEAKWNQTETVAAE
ncbi:MAG: FMN-dependent NADH-azoreductase [Nitrospinaceae bacterium]|nr:MAG: FMN-dependent NADH-azoreductase [Nitrospinaceae bacterium]